MRYEIKSIPVWPVIKIGFFINLMIGFVLGIFMAMALSFITFVSAELGQFYDPGFDPNSESALTMFIILPVMGAIAASFMGIIATLILLPAYNIFSRLLGGFELNLECLEPEQLTKPEPVVAPIATSPKPEPDPVAPLPTSPTATPPPPPPPQPASDPKPVLSPEPEIETEEKPKPRNDDPSSSTESQWPTI